MDEQTRRGEGQHRVEIGLDGKPFHVWESGPHTSPPVAPPPVQGGWEPSPVLSDGQGPSTGSFYPRGTAETAVFATPRNTMEFNHYAWYSLGLGGFAFLGAVLGWAFNGAGMPWFVGLGFAGVGAYYGLRSHNAGLRGFCTNRRLGFAGFVLSVLAAAGTVGFVIRMIVAVSAIKPETSGLGAAFVSAL